MCGPFPVTTKTGKHYFMSIIDNTTRFAIVIAIRKKSDIEAVLCSHLAAALAGLKCWKLCSNQGGKYTGERVQGLLHTASITHEAMLLHTPEHNGMTKQFNQTIVKMVQCMLQEAVSPSATGARHCTPPWPSTTSSPPT